MYLAPQYRVDNVIIVVDSLLVDKAAGDSKGEYAALGDAE
jgi:hypothetical protein